jgi:hypothetical protein
MYISLFTVAIPVNDTNELFWELFELLRSSAYCAYKSKITTHIKCRVLEAQVWVICQATRIHETAECKKGTGTASRISGRIFS